MLTTYKLNKSYDHVTVLHDISFTVDRGMKIGLIGANGTGKTTLFRILNGLETPDSGTVILSEPERLGYLPQSIMVQGNRTVRELLDEAVSDLRRLERRLRELETVLSGNDQVQKSEASAEYGEVLRRFEESGGYEIEWKQAMLFDGMGLKGIDRDRPAGSLSGGEKTRLNLALLLLDSPDILLLDEPTNNLDVETLEWLESYLISYRGGMMIASHDRRFLNATVNRIFELDDTTHGMKIFAGNYDDYRIAKEQERERKLQAYEEQQAEIRELNRVITETRNDTRKKRKPKDSFRMAFDFHGGRNQRSFSRSIRSAKERLSELEENPVIRPENPMCFKASPIEGSIRSDVVLRIENLEKRYGNTTVLSNVSLHITHTTRMVITGANGTGKTTLLRLLTGEETADSGTVQWSPGAKAGYLRQEPAPPDQDKTVLEWYRDGRSGHEEEHIFDLVTTGLFHYDDIKKNVERLSLGQKRKLELARMMAAEPNVLILDEPTNHFSLDVIEELEGAIREFRGPVLAVSHDRTFIDGFAKEIWELREGILVSIKQDV